jgi:hypothetical protein
VTDATSRSSRKQIRNLADLLRVTGCTDVPDLQASVDAALRMDPLELSVHADDVRVEVSTGATGYNLDLPITLGRFWRAVDDLGADLLHLAEVKRLPDWSPESENKDRTEWLADFFAASVHEFVSHVGGRWHSLEPTALGGLNEIVHRWFWSGEPMQVLLGIGIDEVVVAEPIVIGPGYLGPGGVEQGRASAVRLRRGDTLRKLSEEVREMEAWVQSQLTFCPYCRTTFGRGPAGLTCRDCLEVYFQTIVD